MKIFVCWLFLWVTLWGDLPDKIWTSPDMQSIESSEGPVKNVIPSDTSEKINDTVLLKDIPADKNLDDIPLAKTFPLHPKQSELSTVSERVKPVHAEKLQKIMGKELPKQKRSSHSAATDLHLVEKKASKDTTIMPQASPQSQRRDSFPVDRQKLLVFMQKHTLLLTTLLSVIGLMLLTGYFLKRRSRRTDGLIAKSLPSGEYDNERDIFSQLLESFSLLKGEVHQRFLQRKQNILFNDDFTHYQKAKALLELEREYTQIEFVELPKLFSTDMARFTEAERNLSAFPELKDLIYDFIESPLHQRQFTKGEKEKMRENMTKFYPSGQHTWQYDANKDTREEKEQTAYLLQ